MREGAAVTDNRRFEDWKNRAEEPPLYELALRFGAQLKRAGREWVGPCPACGGNDRFGINPSKDKWNCRGFGGGSSRTSMVMHIAGLSINAARQAITGEPPPSGQARELTPAEKAEIQRRRVASEEKARAQAEEDRKYRIDRATKAGDLWRAGVPISETLAEQYLVLRGIRVPPDGWPETLRFVGMHEYELDKSKAFPVLIARVDDMDGKPISVWRIYLDPKTGNKAQVEKSKVGLGLNEGGATRLGGVGGHIDVCEGVETGLAVRDLTNYRRPMWCGLATAGLQNMEFPLEVERVTCWPDGDKPIKRQGEEYVQVPIAPGIRAAEALKERVESMGLRYAINPPPIDADFLDVLNKNRKFLQ